MQRTPQKWPRRWSNSRARPRTPRAERKVVAKPKFGRPKNYVFQYRAPTKTFNLRLQFKKSDVDRTEVIAALEGIIAELRKSY